jgi:L-asparaginase II
MTATDPFTDAFTDAFVPLAVTERSGLDECVHHGAVVVLDVDGDVAAAAGQADVTIYPRSSNKPLQADAMLALGLDVDDESLALACASHDGTERHLAVVRRMLAGAGLGEEALDCTPSLPLDQESAERLLAAGGYRAPILMNCSGKHAAMLATCRHRGWSTDDYLDPGHPLQVAIAAHVAELAGDVRHVGVDGCGAPAHATSLRGLAGAVRRLAIGRGRVWRAMTSHPELVGGETRTVTEVMRRVSGAMAKDGAEGVFALGLPDGRAVALKIADGQQRPVAVVLASALARVGVELDGSALSPPILGHGAAVGAVRAIW